METRTDKKLGSYEKAAMAGGVVFGASLTAYALIEGHTILFLILMSLSALEMIVLSIYKVFKKKVTIGPHEKS